MPPLLLLQVYRPLRHVQRYSVWQTNSMELLVFHVERDQGAFLAMQRVYP